MRSEIADQKQTSLFTLGVTNHWSYEPMPIVRTKPVTTVIAPALRVFRYPCENCQAVKFEYDLFNENVKWLCTNCLV
jgi:hypothetical protein